MGTRGPKGLIALECRFGRSRRALRVLIQRQRRRRWDDGAKDFNGTVNGGRGNRSVCGEHVKAPSTRAGVGLGEV